MRVMRRKPARVRCTCGEFHTDSQLNAICAIRAQRRQSTARRMMAEGARGERETRETNRTEARARGTVTVDTLPSPTWEQFTARLSAATDCGRRGLDRCESEDRGEFPCVWHLYDDGWDGYVWFRGRVWFRGDKRLAQALGEWHEPEEYWQVTRARDKYLVALSK